MYQPKTAGTKRWANGKEKTQALDYPEISDSDNERIPTLEDFMGPAPKRLNSGTETNQLCPSPKTFPAGQKEQRDSQLEGKKRPSSVYSISSDSSDASFKSTKTNFNAPHKPSHEKPGSNTSLQSSSTIQPTETSVKKQSISPQIRYSDRKRLEDLGNRFPKSQLSPSISLSTRGLEPRKNKATQSSRTSLLSQSLQIPPRPFSFTDPKLPSQRSSAAPKKPKRPAHLLSENLRSSGISSKPKQKIPNEETEEEKFVRIFGKPSQPASKAPSDRDRRFKKHQAARSPSLEIFDPVPISKKNKHDQAGGQQRRPKIALQPKAPSELSVQIRQLSNSSRSPSHNIFLDEIQRARGLVIDSNDFEWVDREVPNHGGSARYSTSWVTQRLQKLAPKHEKEVDRRKIALKFGPTPGFMQAKQHSTATKTRPCRRPDQELKEIYRQQVRDISGPPITVTNTINDKQLDGQFQFISKNLPATDIRYVDPEFMTSCSCVEQCDPRTCQCQLIDIQDSWVPKSVTPYMTTATGQVLLSPAFLSLEDDIGETAEIRECNSRCSCNPTRCPNRVVQQGRKLPLDIFMTRHCGFGLRSPRPIARGQFIDTYVGELITTRALIRREKLRAQSFPPNSDGSESEAHRPSYVFSLDFFKDTGELRGKAIYQIDGERFGGPTRFINHSCDPNCRIFTVMSNHNADYRVYELAFFAIRDIKPWEELTFDYNPQEPGIWYRESSSEGEEDGDASSDHNSLPSSFSSSNANRGEQQAHQRRQRSRTEPSHHSHSHSSSGDRQKHQQQQAVPHHRGGHDSHEIDIEARVEALVAAGATRCRCGARNCKRVLWGGAKGGGGKAGRGA